jgi:hypothetical protein
MKKFFILLIIFAIAGLLFIGCSSSSDNPLPEIPKYASENEEFGIDPDYYIVDDYFSARYALTMTDSTKNIFASFRNLTEKSKSFLTQEELGTIDNTSWEMQYIGFSNIPQIIKGALIRDNYALKKVEFELAIKQYQDKEITYEELTNINSDYIQAREDFQNFLNEFAIAD